MELFEFDDKTGKIELPDHLYGIPLFSKFIRKDSDRHKRYTKSVLTYIWFMYSIKSPYESYPEDRRHIDSKLTAGLDVTWSPNDVEKEMINFLKEHEQKSSVSLRMLDVMKRKIDQIRDYLDQVDYTATDESGRPLYNVKEMMGILKEIPNLNTTYKTLYETVKRDLASGGDNLRGGATKGFDEDPS